MARNETVIDLLIASPSDVSEERDVVLRVVDELNLTWRSNLGKSISIIRWETHAVPGTGSCSQEVVNRGLGEDYDVFLGIMWTRFGYPTLNAGSGTEEEFRIAHSNYLENGRPQILFYFKTEGVPLDKLDVSEFSKVNEFKKQIGKEGALYWNFETSQQFEQVLRLHLARIVQDLESSTDQKQGGRHAVDSGDENVEIEELGFFDYIFEAANSISEGGESINRLANALSILTSESEMRTAEMNGLGRLDDPKKLADGKRVADRMAQNMEDFSERVRVEIPIFAKHYQSGVRAISAAASIINDFSKPDTQELEETLEQIREHRFTLIGATKGIVNFRDTLLQFPRITVRLNRARAVATKEMNALISEVNQVAVVLEEVEKVFASLIGKK